MAPEEKNTKPASHLEAGSVVPESNAEEQLSSMMKPENNATEVTSPIPNTHSPAAFGTDSTKENRATSELPPCGNEFSSSVDGRDVGSECDAVSEDDATESEHDEHELLDFLPADFGKQVEQAKQKLPTVVITSEYCTAAKGSDCQRCAYCCPHNAITWREGKAPSVDSDLCEGCGICFGICDTFTPTNPELRHLHKRIARIAVTGRRAHLTCERFIPEDFTPDDNVVVLPCLSMISPALFTQLLAEGIGLTICCDLASCEDCPMGGSLGGSLFPRAIEIAQERTGEDVKHAKRLPEASKPKTLEKALEGEDPLARRQAFEDLASEVLDIVSGRRSLKQSTTLQDYAVKRYRQDAISHIKLPDRGMFDTLGLLGRKRALLFPAMRTLLETILIKPAVAKHIPIALSQTNKALCCESFDCTDACPTGARAIDASGKLEFEPMLCIGCGICVDVCPHGACSVDVTTADSLLAHLAPEKLRAVEEHCQRAKSKK